MRDGHYPFPRGGFLRCLPPAGEDGRRGGSRRMLLRRSRLTAREAARMDRGTRLAASRHGTGFRDGAAGGNFPGDSLRDRHLGGAMPLGEEFYKAATAAVRNRRGQFSRVEHYQPQRQASTVQRALGFRGQTQIISNACASGANAIGHAFHMIRAGRREHGHRRWIRCALPARFRRLRFAPGTRGIRHPPPLRCTPGRPRDRRRGRDVRAGIRGKHARARCHAHRGNLRLRDVNGSPPPHPAAPGGNRRSSLDDRRLQTGRDAAGRDPVTSIPTAPAHLSTTWPRRMPSPSGRARMSGKSPSAPRNPPWVTSSAERARWSPPSAFSLSKHQHLPASLNIREADPACKFDLVRDAPRRRTGSRTHQLVRLRRLERHPDFPEMRS